MLNYVCLKEDGVAISAFAGSKVTIPYVEIGASLQQNMFTEHSITGGAKATFNQAVLYISIRTVDN